MSALMRDTLNPGSAEDNMGFPYAPEGWSLNDVEESALEQGVSLTEDHWQALRALQEYYARHEDHDTPPRVRELHDALDELFHSQGGIKYLYEMFPGGPVAQGCILAGLEPPAGSSDKSFGSVQ
ncbi:MAG: TusE/DsrC/DsvC family sulfur relay protein [Gammaproteobacteria bacterium]|nr:TusE/DsrC/DsvC family sulfur relay protein [Gammaproteobacteria bacterium]